MQPLENLILHFQNRHCLVHHCFRSNVGVSTGFDPNPCFRKVSDLPKGQGFPKIQAMH